MRTGAGGRLLAEQEEQQVRVNGIVENNVKSRAWAEQGGGNGGAGQGGGQGQRRAGQGLEN